MKQELRLHLSKSFPNEELNSWFDPLEIEIDKEEKKVNVSFPHEFFKKWFEEIIQDKFESHLSDFFDNEHVVYYKSSFNEESINKNHQNLSQISKKISFPYDSKFVFDTFLINKKNYFPLASAKEVAKKPGMMFNPFVICGKHGSGKSHLLKAVANEISKTVDPSKIFMGSIDDLENLYTVKCKGDMFKARNIVFEHDYFFIDDLQHISKYENLQNELVLIFNHFHDTKKQMVFATLDKISGCEYLDPVLRSRLEWGLIVTLKLPDLEIRMEYVKEQCERKKLNLKNEQILRLAQLFHDFRYLQGILVKLFAFKELVKKNITQKDFEHIISNTEESRSEELTPEIVIQNVADHFDVTVDQIKGGKRHQKIALARQVAMYLCRNMLVISFPALGRYFGGKDHSTVLYSVKKIEKIKEDNKDMKTLLKNLENKCLHYGGKG